MKKAAPEWQVYRTRFLIRAKQLKTPLVFRDTLGREHRGKRGDYLVESSEGALSIAPRRIFEDIYVPMGLAPGDWATQAPPKGPLSVSRYCGVSRTLAS